MIDPDEIQHPSYPNRNEPQDLLDGKPAVSPSSVEHSQVYATSMLFMSLGAFAVNKFLLRNPVGDSLALGIGLLAPLALGDQTNRSFVRMLASLISSDPASDYDVTNRYSLTKNREREGRKSFIPFV